jgi:hypothetical protein
MSAIKSAGLAVIAIVIAVAGTPGHAAPTQPDPPSASRSGGDRLRLEGGVELGREQVRPGLSSGSCGP